MKNLLTILCVSILLTFACHKNNTPPAARPAAPPPNNVTATNTCTLSPAEQLLVGTWYYERMNVISNGSVLSTLNTYSGDPNYNTITFASTAATISAANPSLYPNFKQYSKVMNGNPYNNLAWKIPSTNNLLLSPTQSSSILIDSVTATRLVYRQGSGYPVMASGYLYTLHR